MGSVVWVLAMAWASAGLGCSGGGSSDGAGGAGASTSSQGAGGSDGPAVHTVSIRGLAQKGPFSPGTTVEVTSLDGSNLPAMADEVATTVEDSTGRFELGTLEHDGPLWLTAEGPYFHEVLGEESLTPVRLRAMVDIRQSGDLTANVNVATHLLEARARALLDGGDVAEAMSQASDELVGALGIGASDLQLELDGASIDVMSDGSDENAYGLALSAVVLQASEIQASNVTVGTAIVPELLDDLAADFADGSIEPDHLELLRLAETEVLTTRTEDLVRGIGGGEAPDLDAVMDTDHDDVVNLEDSCPWVDNPSQEPVLDEVCHAFARPLADAEQLGGVRSIAVGPIDDDEHDDAVVLGADGTLSLMVGGPGGSLTAAHQESLPAQSIQLADVTGDATPELLVTGIDVIDVRLLGDGTASLGQSIVSNVPTQGGGGFALGDVNGDALPDLLAVASFGVEEQFELPLRLLVNQGQAAFVDAMAHSPLPSLTNLAGPLTTSLTDVDGDGWPDAVIVALDVQADEVVVLVYPGDGAAGLGPPVTSRHALPPSEDPAYRGDASFEDVTGDGRPDVTLVGRLDVAAVLAGQPDGTFAAPLTSDVGVNLTHARLLGTGDFTGDGQPDLAAAVDPDFVGGSHMIIVPGRPDGTYGQANTRVARLLGLVSDAMTAAVADLDDDGADDIVIGLQDGGPVAAGVMRFSP